jgi:hypothetical protein
MIDLTFRYVKGSDVSANSLVNKIFMWDFPIKRLRILEFREFRNLKNASIS